MKNSARHANQLISIRKGVLKNFDIEKYLLIIKKYCKNSWYLKLSCFNIHDTYNLLMIPS